MEFDYSVLIVRGAVLIIPESRELTRYDDLVNTVLYAQLAADKQTESEPDVNWYDFYMKVLDGIWMWRGKAREDLVVPAESVDTAVEWAVESMSRVGADEGRMTADALSSIVNESGIDPALDLLRSNMQRVGEKQPAELPVEPAMDVRMLVIVASAPTSFSSVCIEIKTRQSLSANPLAHLYWGEDVQGPVSRRYARAYLSEVVYAPQRDKIALKVKDRIKDNVALLSLNNQGGDAGKQLEVSS